MKIPRIISQASLKRDKLIVLRKPTLNELFIVDL